MARTTLTYRKPKTELKAYTLCKRNLEAICRIFWFRHGGDLDNMIGDAAMLVVSLYRKDKYKPAKGSYQNYIYYHVRQMLYEQLRTRLGRNNRLPRVEMDLEMCAMEEHHLDLEMRCADPDVRKVCEIVLRSHRLMNSKVTPSRQTVIEVLESHLDWRPSKIRKCVRTLERMF